MSLSKIVLLMGVEPTSTSAWEAGVLPLDDKSILVARRGNDPLFFGWKPNVLPLDERAIYFLFVLLTGIEPASTSVWKTGVLPLDDKSILWVR